MQLSLLTVPYASLFFASFYWLTCERVYVFFHTHFICHCIFYYLIFYIFFYFLSFCLLYLQNTLCTRNACSYTYSSNLHACQISSMNFSVLNILLSATHYIQLYFYKHIHMVYTVFCFYYFYSLSVAKHS